MSQQAAPEIVVDLRQPPDKRWALSHDLREQAHALLETYRSDLGASDATSNGLIEIATEHIRPDHRIEMQAMASLLEVPVQSVAIGNLYYDALKVLIGCTAFAVDTPEGPLHARNLDWWSGDRMLEQFTSVTRFVGAPAGEFLTVGWPGFIGALSGLAPCRFAVTLNAVLSLEPAIPATPVVFLLREVLEECRSFSEALGVLCSRPIPCDCLLLLTGTLPGELAVIERTPGRHAVRNARDGHIAVTNDYRELRAPGASTSSSLMRTSCGRFDRITELVRTARPADPGACLKYLSDESVRMQITVQQMIFCAGTGDYWLQFPLSRRPPTTSRAGFPSISTW